MILAKEKTIGELYRSLLIQLKDYEKFEDKELSFESAAILELDLKKDSSSNIIVSEDNLILNNKKYKEETDKKVIDHYQKELFKAAKIKKLTEFLKRNPESKRAILNLWSNETGVITESDPCLMYFWFRINREFLDMHVHFRGNDAINKLYLNIEILTAIHTNVSNELKLIPGIYRHFSDSIHVYKKDLPIFQERIKNESNL